MNPYGNYQNAYGAEAYNNGGAGGYAGGNFQVPYSGDGSNWWGGYDGSGGNGGWGQDWSGGGGGDWNGAGCGGGFAGAGGGKGGQKGGSKGGGKKSVMCKFFAEGRCSKGDSCPFSHVADDDDEEDDPELREIQAAIKQAQAAKAGNKEDPDVALMEKLEDEEDDADRKRISAFAQSGGDNGSDSGDPLPPPATEAEVEEARQIVQKAQRECEERKKNQAKVKTATQDDLQAMINARLAQK